MKTKFKKGSVVYAIDKGFFSTDTPRLVKTVVEQVRRGGEAYYCHLVGEVSAEHVSDKPEDLHARLKSELRIRRLAAERILAGVTKAQEMLEAGDDDVEDYTRV